MCRRRLSQDKDEDDDVGAFSSIRRLSEDDDDDEDAVSASSSIGSTLSDIQLRQWSNLTVNEGELAIDSGDSGACFLFLSSMGASLNAEDQQNQSAYNLSAYNQSAYNLSSYNQSAYNLTDTDSQGSAALRELMMIYAQVGRRRSPTV